MAKDFDTLAETPTGKTITAMRSAGLHRREADLRTFRAYWQGLRHGADVPFRADIDPRGIEPLLGEAFVAERIAPGLARMRIAGTHLSDLMGMEVRGMPLTALIEVEDRARFCNAMVDLFDRPAAIRIALASGGGLRRAPMTGTLLILPLRSDLGDVSRAIGCCVTSGSIGHAPRRFRITGCEITPIDMTAPQAHPQAKSLAETDSHLGHGGADALHSERPYLRLVRG